MKTENTLENKAKFFALYWGQEILKATSVQGTFKVGKSFMGKIYPDQYLILKPLPSITDEDAAEVAKIFNIGHLSWVIICLVKSILQALDGSTPKSETTEIVLHWLHAQDFLRSKGYALPWMGISVEQQVERGWVKLKGE